MTSPEKTLKAPTIPAELWGLWLPGDDDSEAGWVVSVDDAPGGETILVTRSGAEAVAAAEHQNKTYDLWCFPVRIE